MAGKPGQMHLIKQVLRLHKEECYKQLKNRLDYYTSELLRVGVTCQLLWEGYKEDYPDGYGRSQFYYHLSQYIKASKPSKVLHHQAGENLFVDFAGKKLSYIDPATGELIA